jgi:hypothetical protein
MSVEILAATEDATRWREWQVKNAHGQRQGEVRARLGFTVIFIALSLWLGLQLM